MLDFTVFHWTSVNYSSILLVYCYEAKCFWRHEKNKNHALAAPYYRPQCSKCGKKVVSYNPEFTVHHCYFTPQKNYSSENSSQVVLNHLNQSCFCSFHFIVSLFQHFPAWGSLIDLAFEDRRWESWVLRQSVWELR